MQLLTTAGEKIQLKEILSQGAEGCVYKTSKQGFVAKVYQSPTQERIEKLQVMLNYPPSDPNAHKNHVSFAWPLSLLENFQGERVGFLMPGIQGGRQLLQIYNPASRKQKKLEVDWRFLHVTALNVASVIEALHQVGYVLGDIKDQNILVNNRALPSIIDTDSFQVRDPYTGKVHRCPVTTPGYTPPELCKEKDMAQVDQDEVQDRFRLAIIIHCLLFGYGPFDNGKWKGQGESPGPDELRKYGWWPYAKNSKIQPGPFTIPLDVVHPELKSCFLRAFNEGHRRPSARPSAKEWRQCLEKAVKELTECHQRTFHVFSSHWGKCYWCERSHHLGTDIFNGQLKSSYQVSSTKQGTSKQTQKTNSQTTKQGTSKQTQRTNSQTTKQGTSKQTQKTNSQTTKQGTSYWQNSVSTRNKKIRIRFLLGMIGFFLGFFLGIVMPTILNDENNNKIEQNTQQDSTIQTESGNKVPNSTNNFSETQVKPEKLRTYLKVDMRIVKARQQLFNQGWKPVSRTQKETQRFVNDPPSYPETQACLPTGLADCYLLYRKNGTKLVIVFSYQSKIKKVEKWQIEGVPPHGNNLENHIATRYYYNVTRYADQYSEYEKKQKRKEIRQCVKNPECYDITKGVN